MVTNIIKKILSNHKITKNRARRNKLAHIISLRIIKFFYNNLLGNFDKKISNQEYEIIFYPFIKLFTFMILDRQSMIDEFFQKIN